GDSVTVLGNAGDLVRSGYSFNSWNTEANGTGTSYEPGGSLTLTSENVTLYAQWQYVPSGNADIDSIVLHTIEGELSYLPAFEAGRLNYEAAVANELLTVTVTAAAADSL